MKAIATKKRLFAAKNKTERAENKTNVIPTGDGANATAQWRNLLFAASCRCPRCNSNPPL
jgi:hypothetical protein